MQVSSQVLEQSIYTYAEYGVSSSVSARSLKLSNGGPIIGWVTAWDYQVRIH